MDPRIRRELRRRENKSRRSSAVIGPATIGPQSDLGTYDVTYADGSVFQGKGIKVFNTAHDEGDTVVAIPRQDGYIALEGPKARPEVSNILNDPCGNYLAGQIFSCPQPEEIKGRVHILYQHQGRTWIGGHRDTPELVGDSTTTTINRPKLWADSQGWVVLGFESALNRN